MLSNACYLASSRSVGFVGVCDLVPPHLSSPRLDNHFFKSDGFTHYVPTAVSCYLVYSALVNKIHSIVCIGYLIKIVLPCIIVIFVMKSDSVSISVSNIADFPKNFSPVNHQISARIPTRSTIEPIAIGQTTFCFDLEPTGAFVRAIDPMLDDLAIAILFSPVFCPVCAIGARDSNESLSVKTVPVSFVIMDTMNIFSTIDGFGLWTSGDHRHTTQAPANPHIAIASLGGIVE